MSKEIKYDLLSKYCPEFGEVVTTEVDGVTLYRANDILRILGYSKYNWRTTISRNCRYVALCNVPHPQSPNKTIPMNFIPREDVISLLANSQMPKADEFRHWLFGEVVPTIEYTGGYVLPEHLDLAKENPEEFFNQVNQSIGNIKKENESLKTENKLLLNLVNRYEDESYNSIDENVSSLSRELVALSEDYGDLVTEHNRLLNMLRRDYGLTYNSYFNRLQFTSLKQCTQLIRVAPYPIKPNAQLLIKFID